MSTTKPTTTIACDHKGCQERLVLDHELADDAPVLTGGWARFRYAVLFCGEYRLLGTIDVCPTHYVPGLDPGHVALSSNLRKGLVRLEAPKPSQKEDG